CSISCGTKWRNLNNNPMKNKDNIEKMKKSLSETRKSMTEGTYTPNLTKERRDYRSIAFANKEHKCEICGEKNYGVLEVHHKDMNRDNNNISNLMIVCSKCHHLEIHKTIEIDLGHSFTLKYKTTSTRAEGSETNELISRLKELIVDLENNNSITHKRMMGETGGSY
ncbi:MAG: HNH endonuclease, partial [Anaerovoracaceae bacterium]